ncbi:MAG: hypothetical protein M0Q38_07925 [Bacteroidales bacterium]|nr:hypothetical protein [Bacteroidales bacterium]
MKGNLILDTYVGRPFAWLLSPVEAAVTKVHSMELLYRLSELETDIKQELAESIEWRLNEETLGFKNRGVKLLKKLYKEIEDSSR